MSAPYYQLWRDIADRIGQLMDEKEIAQSEMCARMGCVPSSMSKWLNYPVNLTIETIQKFSEALGEPIIAVVEKNIIMENYLTDRQKEILASALFTHVAIHEGMEEEIVDIVQNLQLVQPYAKRLLPVMQAFDNRKTKKDE